MKRRGVLITFEGNEGCGKSTQLRLAAAALRRRGFPVFVTREPGGTRTGDAIRKVLLDGRHHGMSPETETLLYMASRAQLVAEVMRRKLAEGKVVLCDRWLDATVAYQGYGGGVDARWIEELGRRATAGVRPARTVFLDLPVREGLRRARGRGRADRIESKSLRFHEKVRRGFLAIARREPRRFRRIALRPGDGVRAVHARVMEALADVL